MYSINQFILLTQLISLVTGYLYSGHEFNLMQDYYADSNKNTQLSPSAPQFINQPPSQVTFLNETGLVLSCSVYSQPKSTIKWLQPNAFDVNSYLPYNASSISNTLFNNENGAILRYQRADGSLVFAAHSLLNGQSNNYKSIFQCSATNKFGTTLSRPVKMKAVTLNALEQVIISDVSTFRGNNALLQCNIPTHLENVIKPTGWLISDNTLNTQQSTKLIDSLFIPISTTKGKYIVFDDGNLLIGSVTSEDANRKYSCQLTSALLNHQTKSTNWAKLNLINSIDNNESIDQQQSNIDTNELFNLQLIKQLLRSIDQQNHQNKQIKLSKQVHVLLNKQSANNKIKLYCTANQYLNGPVKWFKQTGQTNLESIVAILDDQTTNHFSFEFDTSILTINNPKLKDTGLYIGIISNRLQQSNDYTNNIKCAIQLIIREPLKVEINLSKQNSIKQKDLLDSINNLDNNVHNSMQQNSINCTVYGYPVNQIQFYHNGILLDTVLLSSNNFKSLTDEPQVKSYSLTLNPTYSVIIENGVYQCFAISDYEIETASYTLMQTQEPPKFTNVFKSQTLNAGSTLSLSCTATGNPLPTVIWNIDRKPLTTLNNNYLNPNNLLTSHTSNPIQNSARLRFGDFVTKSGNHVTSYVNISNVRPEDGGLFACIASSSLNEQQHLSYNQLNNNQDQYVINEQLIRINGKPGIKPMDNLTVLEGADLELYCPTYGNFDGRIIWNRLKGSTQTSLPMTTRHEIFTNGSLFIRQINRKQDQGFYVCSIEGTESSMSTYVKIIVGPKIEPFTFSKGLEEGMRAVAVCIVSLGDSPLELKWKRNLLNGETSDELQGAQVESINSFTSSLTFQSLSKEQAGNYTCIARNAAAVTTHTSELIVNVSPYWIKEPTDQEVIKGHSILLSCAADGNPLPQIRWKRISHNNRNQLSNTRTTITPNSIQKQQQSNNEIDTTYRTIISNPHMQILENGSLWINSLTAIDEVDFLCQASNNVNPSLSKVIKLIVRSPPSFDRHFETIAVKAGDYLNLPCNVTSGDLPINYKWKRNGIELSNHISNTAQHFHHPASLTNGNNNQLIALNTEHYQIHLESLNPHQNQFENGLKDQLNTDQETRYWLTLSIAAARRSDSAVFTCLASNKYGNAEKNFRLIVQEKPDPPSSLIVQQITAYSVYLTWASPFSGNSPLLEFRIQCRETGFNGNKQPWTRPNQNLIGEQTNTSSTIINNITGCTEYKRSSLENSLTIQNLSSSTGYELRMSARNALGESEFSELVQFITLEETPTMIPTDLEISALGSKSLKLSWNWPKHLKTEHSTNKQIVKGYNVAYRLVFDSALENNKNNTLQNALSPSATIVNKRNGQQTTIQPATDSTTDLQNKNQNFIVKSIESSDQDKERFVLLGLRKHSKYEVKVQAYNSAGTGPYSASIFGTTLRYDTPKPPKIISAKPTTNSIELKWTAESEDPIQGYIINYRGDEREWTSEQVPNTNTHIVNEIRCGSKYSVYLNAFNEAGRSESSEMVMVKTQGTAPIAPEKSAFLQPNSTSVSLNLHSWVANGCSILYFIVQYREHSSKQWQLISGEIPAETGVLVISDLNPAEWYNLMVRGVNQAGSTQAEYLFSTLTFDGSTIAPITTFNQDGTDNNLMNNEINSGFRLMNLNVSSTRYLLFQKLNIVLPILCGIAVLSLAAVIVCSYQGKLFTNNICTNERNQTTGILGNCSTSSASTNNTAINTANLDSSNCLINELTCGLLADQQQSLICPSITHSQYQPSSNYSECLVHSLNCNEHEYKLCSDVPNLQNLNNINNLNNLNNLNQQNNNQIMAGEFASINKNNMRSNVGLFRSAFNNSNNNNQSIFPSPYAFSRLNTSINEYRTPNIDSNRQDRILNKQQQASNDNLTLNLTDSLDNTTTTFKLKPIISNQSNDQQSIHNYDAPIFLKRVN